MHFSNNACSRSSSVMCARMFVLTIIVYIMIPVIVATLAPIVNSIQIVPQLYKTYLLWLLHGVFINDKSLIVAGSVAMIVNVALLTLYFLYNKNGY